MGRPVNKKHFGEVDTDSGNINVNCKVGSNSASVQGMIKSQRSSNKFLVDDAKDDSGNEGVCTLVDKASENLAADEMSISAVINGTTTYKNIKKMFQEKGIELWGRPFNPPNILFWNLRKTNGFPTQATEDNVTMLSGYSPFLLNVLCEKGFDKKYGARPLKRAIQNHVEDLIAEEIVKSKIKEGSSIKIDHDSKSLKLKIIKL